MKLQQMKQGQFFVTLPTQILRAKKWKKGDIIEYSLDNKGDIVLTRKEKKHKIFKK